MYLTLRNICLKYLLGLKSNKGCTDNANDLFTLTDHRYMEDVREPIELLSTKLKFINLGTVNENNFSNDKIKQCTQH